MTRAPQLFTVTVALCLNAPALAQTTAQELWRDVFGLHVVSAKMDADGNTLYTGYDAWEGSGYAVSLDPAGNRTVHGTWWHLGDGTTVNVSQCDGSSTTQPRARERPSASRRARPSAGKREGHGQRRRAATLAPSSRELSAS